MAGTDKDELNRIRTRLSNVSDEQGDMAIFDLSRDADGDVRIQHPPGAADEISTRMEDLGYERREQLDEGELPDDEVEPGNVISVFTPT